MNRLLLVWKISEAEIYSQFSAPGGILKETGIRTSGWRPMMTIVDDWG